MVNNINQPLEISAISSPEQSGRSPCGPDLDQPPVLKRERPLELNNTGRYSSTPSSDEEGENFAPDSSNSSRIERKIATISLDRDGPIRDLERGSQGRKSGPSSVNSEVSSSSGGSKWKSTFSPISDPKPTSSDRQGGSPFGVGASRGAGGGTDSDSDQKPQRRGEREPYGNSNLFLSQDGGGGRSVVNVSERPPQKQKSRDWDLKTVSGLASQNLFISAAASGGILSGKVGGATTVSSAPSVGQYFPLGGASVLQSLFGAQTPGATGGAPRLVNGHSALGSFSSAGLAGGAAGGT